MMYAVCAEERQSFDRFEEKMRSFLKGTNVIEAALGRMREQARAGQLSPSLIRAAAEVYATDALFGPRTFGQLLDGADSPIEELAFNATEFRTGNSFRFQKSRSPDAVIGNGLIEVKREVARSIRLADIAAASSCFPSAFEPIRFPDDFQWPPGRSLAEIRRDLGARLFTPGVALMDGGIFDNQGVGSIIQIYKRRVNQNRVGLVIISDTSQSRDSLYEFPPRRRRGRLTLAHVAHGAWALFLVSLLTSVSLATDAIRSLQTSGLRLPGDIFRHLVPFGLSLSVAILLAWLRARFLDGLRCVREKTGLAVWPLVRWLTIPDLIDLLSSRAGSLIALTTSVFTKRVRGMIYKDINLYEKYRGRLVQNLVYDLRNESRRALFKKAPWIEPTRKLKELAAQAEAMPTTLWFTRGKEEEELDRLVRCGRATMCFNLLRYMLEKQSEGLSDPRSEISKLFQRARAIWAEINTDH